MAKEPIVRELIRVTVVEKQGAPEVAGGWCMCPRTGKEVRAEDCIGCVRAVEFHRTCAAEPFILCDINSSDDALVDGELGWSSYA